MATHPGQPIEEGMATYLSILEQSISLSTYLSRRRWPPTYLSSRRWPPLPTCLGGDVGAVYLPSTDPSRRRWPPAYLSRGNGATFVEQDMTPHLSSRRWPLIYLGGDGHPVSYLGGNCPSIYEGMANLPICF